MTRPGGGVRATWARLRADPGVLALLLALGAAILLYAPTLGRGLVEYDDGYLIRDNWILQQPSWSSLHTILFDLDSPRRFTLSPEYLPVRDLSIMIDIAIWGDWYPGFHLTNLVLYLAAIIVWFAAFVGLGIDRRIAGLAILLWAVHPSHAESVAWLAERKGLLAAVLAGACVLAYARFRAGRHGGWLVLAMIAAVLAIWSKAHAAFAIAALVPLALVLPGGGASPRRTWTGLVAIGLVSAAAFVPVLLLATASSVVGPEAGAPGGRVALVLGVHGFYLAQGLLLSSNAIAYPLSTDGPSTAQLVLGAVGLVAALAVTFAPRGRAWSPPTVVRAGVVLWLVCWLPVSHLVLPLQMVIVADRYLLLPSLGLALVLAAALLRLPSLRGRRALIATVMIASLLRTFDAQSNWRDATTLWQRAVRSSPHDGEAWAAYAEARTRAGDHAGAAEVVSRGLRQSRAPRLLLRKALVLLENGNRSAGLTSMRAAAEAGEPRAMSNLALLLLADGEREEALRWAREGARRMPMYVPANRTHGKVALAAGHAAEAVGAFTRAHELAPQHATNRYNLALALAATGRVDRARTLFRSCLADPELGPLARAALAR